MSDNAALRSFCTIFRGNPSFFVKHQPPFTEHEGKFTAAWCNFAVYNKHTPPPKGKEEGDAIPLTIDRYRDHLNGKAGLAVAPLMNVENKKGEVVKQNVCYFAAIDIDVYGVDFTFLIRKLYQAGFKFVPFISKSGGLHIYFFFRDAEPGSRVIETLKQIVGVYGLDRLFVGGKNKGKVEIFPKQATFVPGGEGGKGTKVNALFLPFYNISHPDECKSKMLTGEGKKIGLTKTIPYIDSMFTSVSEIKSVIAALPYSDAPFCVQMVLLTGALSANEGRNNFLFSAAIYLKKKYKDDFMEALLEMNNCLEAPLEEKDIEHIYTSATNPEKNYDKYSCTKPPCSDYCDKKACKAREFGPERDRNNRFTGADCWGMITRYDTGDGKEPYYIWQVRVKEGEDFRTVQIDSYKDMLNQSVVQQNCLRDLNWVPFTVKANDWITAVLKGLSGIEERTIKVAPAADTTETAALRESFIRYLTRKQIQRNEHPSMVRAGHVCHTNNSYYFSNEGLMKFLRFEKYNLSKFNMREWLIRQGCKENAKLEYKTPGGAERSVECWQMPENEELLSMDTFYEEIYEADADIIQKNPVVKDTGEKDDVTKF